MATLLASGMPEKPADGAPAWSADDGQGGGGPLEQTAVRSTAADDAPPRRPPATPERLVPSPDRDALRRDQRDDRALALATQAFVALVPMLIVVAAAMPDEGRAALGGYVVDHLRLSGSAAGDVHELVRRPPQPTEPVTLVGVVVLVVSVLGFTRTLQRAYQAAWRLSPQGVWGYAWGLLGAVALIAETVVFLLIGLLVDGAVLPTVLLRLVVSVLMWWPVQWLLLGRRVGWRRLLPGAALVGMGQVVVIALSGGLPAAGHRESGAALRADRRGVRARVVADRARPPDRARRRAQH